jgi:hypothetical protein
MPDEDKSDEQTRDLLDMAWQILIRRDQLLKLAGGLPAADRVRVLKIAADFEGFSERIRGLVDGVPLLHGISGTPEETLAGLQDMRSRIDGIMSELAAAAKILFEIAGPPSPKASERAN